MSAQTKTTAQVAAETGINASTLQSYALDMGVAKISGAYAWTPRNIKMAVVRYEKSQATKLKPAKRKTRRGAGITIANRQMVQELKREPYRSGETPATYAGGGIVWRDSHAI